jgi:UDP-4-amino-4,6-dideoxy-N-acetyl-beta-L-altrosamine transaminase
VIPYGRQDISQDDIDAVISVLRSDWLTQGPTVPRFEKVIAEKVGAVHCVAVNSATSALHIACLALGLGSGDVLWTVPNTFVASANCARYCGAEVDFVDIDLETGNMSTSALHLKLLKARRDGRLPKIVVPVAFAGQSCDMQVIKALSAEFDFFVIEDASHAIGASYLGKPVGCGDWADITVFSFHPVKIVTTAEGGCAVTNDAELASRMALLRSHGVTKDPDKMEMVPDGPWSYEMIELGWNYRMTDVQAALGVSQVGRIDSFLGRRRAIAARYEAKLVGTGLRLPCVIPDSQSAWHLYAVGWNQETSGVSRSVAVKHLHSKGIGVNVHYIPVHTQPYYRRLGFNPEQCPNALRHYSTAISLPLFPGLTLEEQDRVVSALKDLL